jgi:hypothetical protein
MMVFCIWSWPLSSSISRWACSSCVRRPSRSFSQSAKVAISPANNQELVQAVRETRDAVRALPSRIRAVIDWTQADTLTLEVQLNEVQQDREFGNVR